MQNVIEKTLNNIVIAALIPSLVFSTVIFVVFRSTFPTTIIDDLVSVFQELGVFLFFVSFCISLFLVYLREVTCPRFLCHLLS